MDMLNSLFGPAQPVPSSGNDTNPNNTNCKESQNTDRKTLQNHFNAFLYKAYK